MSTRIRYIDRPDGSKISGKIFKDKDGYELRAKINPDQISGEIVLAVGEAPVANYTATSPHKIKIKLKAALQKLGVKFEREKKNV
jgi:hypothetical protein